jgi:hypothetical protein
MGVADATVKPSPLTFAYARTNIAVAAWVFPTNFAQIRYEFPGSNTRQIVVLNTGINPILFGQQAFPSEAALPSSTVLGLGVPYAFPNAIYTAAAGAGFVVQEGDNCTRIPVGGSLSIELLSFQERGNFHPVNGFLTAYPVYTIFFAATGAGLDSQVSITYVSKLGTF